MATRILILRAFQFAGKEESRLRVQFQCRAVDIDARNYSMDKERLALIA